jgi:hypothetical protein
VNGAKAQTSQTVSENTKGPNRVIVAGFSGRQQQRQAGKSQYSVFRTELIRKLRLNVSIQFSLLCFSFITVLNTENGILNTETLQFFAFDAFTKEPENKNSI